jgi:hypothetical protein
VIVGLNGEIKLYEDTIGRLNEDITNAQTRVAELEANYAAS